MSKILYLCGDLSLTGGIEKYNKDFISALELEGVDIRCVERKVGGIISKIFFFIKAMWVAISFRPEQIICAHLYFSPLVLVAKIILGINYSLVLYGIEAVQITKFAHKKAVIMAARLVVISQYTKNLVQRQFNFEEQKYFLLPSSVNGENFSVVRDRECFKSQFDLMDDELIILTLSRLSNVEEKGQHRVLLALEHVVQRYPKVKYLIAGPGEDLRVDSMLASKPELAKRVLRLGKISNSEKNTLYNLCDVFILPSKVEGFGIVFIEALACGARVIAADGFGCKEALLNGKLGQVVSPDSSEEMADLICQCLSEANDRSYEDRLETRKMALQIYGYKNWCQSIHKFIAET